MTEFGDFPRATIIGGGPAGLMAAEVLAAAGVDVDLFDAMPSVGRKFLMAGRGGLNLTHSEAGAAFLQRYGDRQEHMAPLLAHFGAAELRAWAHGLGIDTFVGSSGRVFPTQMKAAPLLRAWLARLRRLGVRFRVRHRCLGWNEDGSLRFATAAGEIAHSSAATLLALGGGSWPQLGADGAWTTWLAARGVAVAPLLPANCGFDVSWSAHFREKFAGQPLKSVIASCVDAQGRPQQRQGECVVSADGIEGGLIYALAAPLRDAILSKGAATLYLDLAPGRSLQRVQSETAAPRGARSLASHLQSKVSLNALKVGLLRECLPAEVFAEPLQLAAAIKALPLSLSAPRPLAEAISSAGGVRFEALDANLMLHKLPGVFCAGEMLDWEAPTGGYLLTGCMASGHAAARGMLEWLALQPMTSK